jgi:hypothetical protein
VPDSIQAREKVWHICKSQSALAVFATRDDLGLECRLSGFIFAEPQFLSNSKLAAGANQGFPLVLAEIVREQDFHPPTQKVARGGISGT